MGDSLFTATSATHSGLDDTGGVVFDFSGQIVLLSGSNGWGGDFYFKFDYGCRCWPASFSGR